MSKYRAGQFMSTISLVVCLQAQAQFEYKLTILPLPEGLSDSLAMDVNDVGVVAGSIGTVSTYHHAAAWFDGEVVDLTGIGISGATARGINEFGTIVGMTDEFGINAYQWQEGGLEQLVTPSSCCSEAWSINSTGVICGHIPSAGIGSRHACIWIGGQWQLLADLGGSVSSAYDINDRGEVVGVFSLGNGQARGCIWADGVPTELPVPEGFSGNVWSVSINAHGTVVGYGDGRGMKWMGGEVQELMPLSPDMYNHANDLNDDDIIVGYSYGESFEGSHACRWVDGQVADLNELVDRGEWRLYEAASINSGGVIVGMAFSAQNERRAYCLEPIVAHCPEDLDGDGVVGVNDLLALLGGFGIGDDGDVDGDGDTDVNDVLLLLAAYGSTCA